MSTGSALLATLDAMLPGSGPAAPGSTDASRRTLGLIAATALDTLLSRHRLGWEDVAPGSRLAKLCGHLGSDYAAEREAAYDHAVRLIVRGHSTWTGLVRLPALQDAPPASAPPMLTVSPPDADWLKTVRGLQARRAGRCEGDRTLLDTLAGRLAAGQAIAAEDARQVRDIWWHAELDNHEEATP